MSNKVRIFLWHAFSEALPTKLICRNEKFWTISVVASVTVRQQLRALSMLCGAVNTSFLFGISLFMGVRRDFPQLASFSDLVSITSQESRNLELFAMVTWSVWLRRNKLHCNEPINKIFWLRYYTTIKVSTGGQGEITEAKASPGQVDTSSSQWVKVNFEGAIFAESNEAGLGVKIKNESGEGDGGVIWENCSAPLGGNSRDVGCKKGYSVRSATQLSSCYFSRRLRERD